MLQSHLFNGISEAGTYVKEQILSSFVRLIATTPELAGNCYVRKLYAATWKEDITQEGITLGQAGNRRRVRRSVAPEARASKKTRSRPEPVQESELVDSIHDKNIAATAGQVVTEVHHHGGGEADDAAFVAGRGGADPQPAQKSNQTNLDVEIQQRAVE